MVKWYAIHRGYGRGVTNSWDEALKMIKGFPGSIYALCATEGEANYFVQTGQRKPSEGPYAEHVAIVPTQQRDGTMYVRNHVTKRTVIPPVKCESVYLTEVCLVQRVLDKWATDLREPTLLLRIDVTNISTRNAFPTKFNVPPLPCLVDIRFVRDI